MDLQTNLPWNDEKPALLSLQGAENCQVLAIGLKAGQVLKKHRTPVPALLVVMKGSIQFSMEGEDLTLPACTSFEIPFDVMHEVTGIEESIFLIIREKT
jgi:quercetin dioxygenase-like cupin family protein